MADIKDLNFKVILDDKDFNKKIKADIDAANDLNLKLSKLLDLKAKLNNETTKQLVNAEKVKQAEQDTAKKMAQTAEAQQKVKTEIERTAAAQRSHTGAIRQTNDQLFTTRNIMRTLTQLTGVTFGVTGLRRFLAALIDITGQFEVQRMALRNMLQDVDGADKIFEDLYRFSSDSTYRFSELAKYAKQLAAFNIDQGNLLETTKMLGDVASGVGVSMDRLILAYGHVKSSGFLRGIQLRSFSQNGVPILDELSRMFTEIEGKAVSLGDVFDRMTKREIPFEMVEEAFRRMTSEGGKFYQMQEVLAKTLSGQINILKGRWENMLAAVGQANSGPIKSAVSGISNVIANYENFGKYLKELIAAFGVYQATLLTTTALTEGLAAATNVGLLGALKKVGLSMLKNPYALLAAGVTAASVAIYELSTQMSSTEKIQESVTKGIHDYKVALASETVELDRLYAKLNLAKEGTEQYDAARREIENRFGPYIQELQNEGVAVDNLASIYNNLAQKIEDANKQRFLESTTKSIQDRFGEAAAKIQESFEYTLKLIGKDLSIAEQETLWQYIVGAIDKNDIRMANLRGRLDRGGDYNGPYSGGTYNHSYSIEQLKDQYVAAAGAYQTGMKAAEEAFKVTAKTTTNETIETIKDWEKKVKEAIEKINPKIAKKVGLNIKDNEQYYDYLERIGKEFKEINEQKDKALKADKPEYENWINAIKEVDRALEGNILSDVRYNKTPWKGSSGSSSSDPNSDARANLRAQIAVLEKYKSAYDKLEPFFGDKTSDELKRIFGSVADFDNLDTAIERLIADLRSLGDEKSLNAAESIEASLGLDEISKDIKVINQTKKAIEEQKKALESYQKTLQKWQKDYGGRYTGFDAELDKVVVGYNNELQRIDDEYIAAQKDIYKAYSDDVDAIKRETDALYELYEARRKAAYGNAAIDLNALAQKHVKDATSSLGLSDWGDKSIGQVFDIYKALGRLAESSLSGDLKISDGVRKELEKAGLSLEDFSKLSYDEFKKLGKNAKEELLKKLGTTLKEVASDILDVASSYKEWAEASGDLELSERISDLQELGSTISNVAQRALQGDWIGAVTAGISGLAKSIISTRIEIAKLEANLSSAREEARANALSNMLSFDVDSIFGTNDLKKVNNAVSAIAMLRDSMREYMSDVQSMEFNTTKRNFWARFFGAATNEKNPIFNTSSLEGMAKAVGGDLYDSYGNLNADTLQKILDTYPNLDSAQREWIDHAIKDSKAYADAMKQTEAVAESLFGDIASNVADKMVDSWWEAGQAALDYADILGDVAKAYAKIMVQDMLMETAFDSDKREALKEAFRNGDASKAMQIVTEAMESAEAMLPAVNAALQAFEPYRNLSAESSDDTSSVGSGIKSITEDTANLLASYINAIRADVSYMRLMQEKGWNDVAAIAESISSPTLNDYIAQCTANTYDISASNRSILEELRSVIGAPGTSGMVVRVDYS